MRGIALMLNANLDPSSAPEMKDEKSRTSARESSPKRKNSIAKKARDQAMELNMHKVFDVNALEDNVKALKKNLVDLSSVHAEEISSKVLDHLARTFSNVNTKISKFNDWAKSKLSDFHQEKKDQKELEIQIGIMESEGNVPQPFGQN